MTTFQQVLKSLSKGINVMKAKFYKIIDRYSVRYSFR